MLMYVSLCNVFFGYKHFQFLSNVYHCIFLIVLQYLYITGYTPFGCPYSFCCCVKFVLNFISFLKLRKLHSSFHVSSFQFKNCTSGMTCHSLRWIVNWLYIYKTAKRSICSTENSILQYLLMVWNIETNQYKNKYKMVKKYII